MVPSGRSLFITLSTSWLITASAWSAQGQSAVTRTSAPAPTSIDAPVTLTASVERDDAMYKVSEEVSFKVDLSGGAAAQNGTELTYTLSKDGVMPPLQNGTVKVTPGQSVLIKGKMDEPGFLHCFVTGTINGKRVLARAGAAIDALKIQPSQPVPDDFDAFWEEQRKHLAEIPMNAKLTPMEHPASNKVSCFDVQIDCVGGLPASAYFARPLDAKPKSLPALLVVHGAGVRSSQLNSAAYWSAGGILAMDMNAHGIQNGKPDAYYKALEAGALKDYRFDGRDSRDKSYFLGMFLRGMQALNFLCEQPEWDGKTLVVHGVSQGGYQAIVLSGLDKRVTFCSAGVAAGCDHTGGTIGRIAGWPKLVPFLPDGITLDPKVLETSRYFDAVNFATRAKVKGAVMTVGFIDTTCPPTSVYAAYNALPCPTKAIYNDIHGGHASSPMATQITVDAVRRHIVSQLAGK